MFKDYYKILEVAPEATQEEIKKAYRSQSLRWHPDKNPGVDTTAKMQDINEAYNILKDSTTRARYDAEYAKFYSARSEQPKTTKAEAEYDIKDETLKEDIKEARKAAEDYVREFYSSLKKDSKKAAQGAWEEAKGPLGAAVILAVIGLIVFAFIKNNPNPTPMTSTKPSTQNASEGTTGKTFDDANSKQIEIPQLRLLPKMETGADPNHWKTMTLYDAFSITVPSTVERQTKNSPYGRELASKGVQLQEDLIIFNQKGLCDLKPEAKEQYCRIMINFIEGEQGDFLKRDQTKQLDWEYKQLLSEMVTNEISSNSRQIGSFNSEWVRVNNANAILVSYRRTGNNYNASRPVNCKILLFQDDNRLVKMILSYREDEANLWTTDFEQVMRSFEWKN